MILNQKNKGAYDMLFLLDLDETLLFSDGEESDGKWFLPRPHLTKFLHFIHTHFQIAIYTTASFDYTNEAIKLLFPFPLEQSLVFHKKYTEKTFNPELLKHHRYKKIHKISDRLGFGRDDVVFLDDLGSARITPLSKVIKAPKFKGDPNDDFLLVLKNKIELVLKEGFKDNIDFVNKLGYIAENKPEYHCK